MTSIKVVKTYDLKARTGKTVTVEILEDGDVYYWDAKGNGNGPSYESDFNFDSVELAMADVDKVLAPRKVGKPRHGTLPKSKIHASIDADLAEYAKSTGNLSAFVNEAMKAYKKKHHMINKNRKSA